ncbi:MAG: CsiV family protein [Pseudomonadales bacterium]
MPRIHSSIGLIIFVTLTVVCSVALQAQDQERWFTIELLIFKNGGNAWQREDWESNPELYYPEPLLVSSALSMSDETDTPTKELEFDGKLADAAEKLMNTGQYRILYTRRWQQGLLKTKDAPHLLITGGDQHGAHYELEGSIKFSVERYLHVNTNLWFATFGEPEVQDDDAIDSYADASEDSENYDSQRYGELNVDDEWDEFEEDFEEPMVLPSPPWNSEYIGPQESILRVVTLKQTRRLRSKETHYIDHPSIGILIRIEPVPDADASNGED